MGWIARLSDGNTIKENDFLAEGKKFQHLPHKIINSLQVLFAGNYVTVTRANDTQRFIQLKIQRTTTSSDKLPEGHPLKSNPHIITLIGCVYNTKGDIVGWAIDYENNKIVPYRDTTDDLLPKFEDFGLTSLDSIIDGKPNLFIYTMRRDEGDFTIQ